jgi:hypothetical protein
VDEELGFSRDRALRDRSRQPERVAARLRLSLIWSFQPFQWFALFKSFKPFNRFAPFKTFKTSEDQI